MSEEDIDVSEAGDLEGEDTVEQSDNQAVIKKDEEEETYQMSFSSYQLFLFVSCYLAYAVLLYNRKSFTFSLPFVIMEEYFSSYEIGLILSAQTFTYSISKFFFSWASDHYSPKALLAGGLFFSGFVMLAFSDQEDWSNIMILVAANGLAQGMGWPAVTKMIRAWFPPTQFGMWFAFLSTASNVVSGIGPVVAQGLGSSYGWRMGMQLPAALSMIAALIIPSSTWNAPSDVGYEDQLTMFGKTNGHWSDLAGSEFMMFLISTYCLLFVVKTSCQDWGQIYLLQERGLTAQSASSYLYAMEVGGLVGCITLGALTDFMIKRGFYAGTGKSPRLAAVQFCVAACCLFLNLFLFTIDPDTSKFYMTMLGFMMGYCMYGAISLLVTIAVEVAPIHMTGSAHGAIGMAACVGAVVAGFPINYIAKNWDWFTAFMGINFMSILTFVIVVAGKDINATFVQKGGPKKIKTVILKKAGAHF